MFGEILDGSFQAIRRNAKAMLGAGLLAQSLSAILAAVLTGVIGTSSGSIKAWAGTASKTDVASLGIGLMAGFAVLSILSVFMSVVLQGAMVVPLARSVLNRPTGFRRMMSLVRPRIGALFRLAAVLVAAALAAMMLFFALIVLLFSNVRGPAALLAIPLMMGFAVVFLWVAIKLLVAPAAVVIEELGAFAALRRSWNLTRANWWRILGITLVVGILVAVITQVVLIPASLLPTVLSGVISPHGGSGQDATLSVAVGILTAVVGALVGAVGYAFQTSVMALLYMDLRMRKDGLDIALLRDMETGADPDGIPGRTAQAGTTPYPGYGTAPGAWPYGR
ncbi:glycerophosphoryl diester phosphodiesterase membrane domain-containing protein [Arthrobacter sp. ISL-85]|nr:glycerophosphoryl diester phosphodiesterase membrane domain-containing protein [Arthrobacter sp. ISL-85]